MNALATALKVNVNIAYLDGHDQHGQVSFVPFQNAPFTVIEPVNLLYRCVWMFSPSPWPAPLTASPPSYQTGPLRYPGPEGRGSFATPARMNNNLMGGLPSLTRTADSGKRPRYQSASASMSSRASIEARRPHDPKLERERSPKKVLTRHNMY